MLNKSFFRFALGFSLIIVISIIFIFFSSGNVDEEIQSEVMTTEVE